MNTKRHTLIIVLVIIGGKRCSADVVRVINGNLPIGDLDVNNAGELGASDHVDVALEIFDGQVLRMTLSLVVHRYSTNEVVLARVDGDWRAPPTLVLFNDVIVD